MYSMWVVGTNSKKFENSIFQYWCFFPVDIMTSLCCFTNWKSEWFPSKHRCTTNYFPLDDVLQCGVPEHNERDILMMFHLFICRKWRGTAMDWNSWQNKDPALGEWLYLWFQSHKSWYQERGRVTRLWQFKVLNDVIYGGVLWHGARTLRHSVHYRMNVLGLLGAQDIREFCQLQSHRRQLCSQRFVNFNMNMLYTR